MKKLKTDIKTCHDTWRIQIKNITIRTGHYAASTDETIFF